MVEHGCGVFMGVPTNVHGAPRRRHPLRRPPGAAVRDLRRCLAAPRGPRALPDVYDAPIHEGYGLTETSPVADVQPRRDAAAPGTIGTRCGASTSRSPTRSKHDAIVMLPHGEIGELVIRGHNLMNGYLDRPEDTAEAIVDGGSARATSARRTTTGTSRSSTGRRTMIIRNGYNVYPRQVEEVLATHPASRWPRCFGVPHELHGQKVEAAVGAPRRCDRDARGADRLRRGRDRRVQVPPGRARARRAAPRPSGKILKRELVERFGTRSHGVLTAARAYPWPT